MSGFAVILSTDVGARARGPQALRRLRHLDAWREVSREVDDVWMGACGPPGLCDVTTHDALRGETDAEQILAVVSGEILNVAEVAGRLGLPGPLTPAKVVVAAYERWGGGLFTRLEGAFALAVYDRREKKLVAGVDARGLSTLHAVCPGDDLLVASEAKAFLVDDRFTARLSQQALAELVTVGWVTRARGLFDGVESPPLGHHLEAIAGRIAIVRHADDRDLVGGDLRGAAYLERLEDAVRGLCREAFSSDDVLLPLTGGIDSRLLAVAVPDERRPPCFSFGAPDDYDVHIAARVAARRGYRHTVIPVEPAYVARFATQTAWLSEGRINPVSNITGSLMDQVGPGRAFVSGQGGEVGRRFLKSRMMVPDWSLLDASPPELERRLVAQTVGQVFDDQTLEALFGSRAGALREAGEEGVREGLERTRDLDVVDRVELHMSDAEFWEGRPWMTLAGVWLPLRAPFHTTRWLEAVLAGAASERIDDVVRLRLIARIDAGIGRIPSSLTRLPLPASACVLSAVRRMSRIAARPDRSTAVHEGEPAARGPAAGESEGHAAGGGMRLARAVAHRLHPHVDEREQWLRTRSWGLVDQILGDDPLAARGVVEPGVTARVLDRCRGGENLARPVGILLGLELWHRLFVDGDLDLAEDARA